MSGYTLQEIFGENPRILKSGQHSEDYYHEMWHNLSAKKRWSGVFINKAKDGHLYEVEQNIFPLYSATDELIGYTAIQQDVTERNRIQKQDEQAQRLESLGVLAGGIAHDFNNLLTTILGNAEMAKITANNPERYEKHLDRICRASDSAAHLCQQMLAYSGKGSFVIRQLKLSEIILNMSELLHASISKSTRLHFDLDDAQTCIQGDEGQIQQVVMNLLINASEALDGSTGHVYLSTGYQNLQQHDIQQLLHAENMTEGQYVYIDVRDTGCGMDSDTLKKMFDPFFTTKFTGRGLGMSAILGIVRGHHGGLDVQTNVGEGTQFRIYFPACQASKPSSEATHAAVASTQLYDKHVLVVDDEEPIRELTQVILTEAGIHTLFASDGDEGLKTLREHHDEIDLVLLDMTMPNMNGQQFYQQMQSFAAEIPVIVASGYAASEIRQRFSEELQTTEASHLAFIEKPYTPKGLIGLIQTQLEQQQN